MPLPWVGALAADLAFDVPDSPPRLARLSRWRRALLVWAGAASLLAALSVAPPLPAGLLVGETLALVAPITAVASLALALGLRALRRRLGSEPEALAASAGASAGTFVALVLAVVAAALAISGRAAAGSAPFRWVVAGAALALALGHLSIRGELRPVGAALTTRRVVTAFVVLVVLGVGVAELAPIVPRDPVALGLVAAGMAALSLGLGAVVRSAVEWLVAPDAGRLLAAIERAEHASAGARELDTLGAAILAPLRAAARTPDADALLYVVEPARVARLDAAGLAHVESRELSPALLERMLARRGEIVLRAPIDALVVRRPDLRALAESLGALDALAVVPLVHEGELEGALVVPRGVRRSALTLEELGALERLAQRITPVVGLHAATLRGQRREADLMMQRERLEERVDGLEDELARARQEAARAKEGAGGPSSAPLVAYGPAMRKVVARIDEIAPLDAPIVLAAEPGVALAPLVRLLHDKSPRRTGPIVVADCANVRPEDAELALFGDDLRHGTPGWLRLAAGGTLLLERATALGTEVLRELDEAIATRHARSVVGGTPYAVDVRVVLGLHDDPSALVERSSMDAGLAERVSALRVDVPPLRERGEDLGSLVLFAIDRACRASGSATLGIAEDALAELASHDWPGNELELFALIERAVRRASPPRVTKEDVGALVVRPSGDPLAGSLADIEKRALDQAAALLGGAIDVASARRAVGGARAAAAALLVDRGGAEHHAQGRLALTPALAETLALTMETAERRALAARLIDVAPRGTPRALARAALGPPRDARIEVLDAATALRDAASPERAAWLLARARRFGDDEALALAESDAWMAAGRSDEAIAALDGLASGRAGWLRAEALRRAGRFDEAAIALEAAVSSEPALALATRARIALATGQPIPALAAAPSAGDPVGAAFVDETRALAAHRAGQPRVAMAIAQQARRALEEARDVAAFDRRRALARLDAVEAGARAALGDAEGAHAAFERSAGLAAAAGERHATAAFLVNLGIGRLDLGALGPALDALARGAERLVLLGRDRDAARALYNVANAALLTGDRAHARHAAEGALREARRVSDDEAATLAEIVLADVDVGEGRPRAAERRLEALLARGSSWLAAARLATLRALALDPGGAEQVLRGFRDEAEPASVRLEVALAEARIALARGDAAACRQSADRARALLGEHGAYEARLRWLATEVDVAEAEGDAARAEGALRAQRSALDAALASLPSERQAQFRALHARALASRPLPEGEVERSRPAPPVLAHARALVEETRTSAIAARLVASARALASAEHAALVVREPSGALVVRAAHGPAGPLDAAMVRVSTSIVSRCLEQRARLSSIDAGTDLALAGGASIHTLAVRSVVALPVTWPERDAVLYVDDRLRPSAFGPDVERALDELGAFAAIALAQADRARKERRAQAMAARRERLLRASLEEKTRDLAIAETEHPARAELVLESDAMRRVAVLASRVAASEVPVLLTGESGTGKEVLARYVHRASTRAAAPFVAESCAAIPLPLLESTLFGHVRGAFSGASARKRGLFELAEGGTLFLDEVGEMPPARSTCAW